MTVFDKHRKRRVIYNDDSDQQYEYEGYPYKITDEQSFIDARTTPTFDTHVDTYVWCVGNGAEPPWGGQSAKLRPCLGSHAHATDLIVEACHSKSMEVWGSLRMNDIHDSFRANALEEASEPIKAEHPEYLIAPEADRELPRELTERRLWTALDFARREVREYRLDFIERNASAHDFDGYELDFTRFVWTFPLGEERAHAPEMTELIREARTRLNDIGERRGRPYTFAVHVMDSPDLSLALGRDVEGWLNEGLVDVLVVGMGYLPYALRLDQWLAQGRRCGVPVYPSVNTNTYIRWWKELFHRPSAWQEAVRAGYAYYRQQGAEGVYVFNLFCLEDKNVGPLPRDFVYAPLREIGDPTALAGKDKLYAIQPTAQSGFCHHGSEAAALPIALDNVERKLPLKMGADADDANVRFTISVWATGGTEDVRVWLRLNHSLLPQPKRQGAWFHVGVPPGLMRTGHNELSIWCSEEATSAENPIIVHYVFASAKYGT